MANQKTTINMKFPLGFGGILFIVFLILKLCGQIDWSWWWVTCPLWGQLVIVLLFMIVALVGLIFTKK